MTALVTLVVAAAFLTGVGRLGDAVVDQARAQSIADAVALVAAEKGVDEARVVAIANRNHDPMIEFLGGDVRVTVEVDGRVAIARASTGR